MPLVSVIIPCYRQAHFLPQAVRSVLDQTLSDIEAIVIDDGSPDDPYSHLGDLARDPRVVFRRQENAGLGAARNAGIGLSRGVFLNFLDADDWLAPHFCERLVPILSRSDELGFVYCDMNHVFENTLPQPEKESYSVGRSRRVVSGNILPSLLLGGYFSPQTVLIRKTVLDHVGSFDSELGGHADWDLWLRVSASGYSVQYVDEKLVYYRIHGSNMSADVEHMRSTRLQTLRKLFRLFPDVAAGAIDDLCRTTVEQFAANRFLQEQLNLTEARLQQRTGDAPGRAAEYRRNRAERLKTAFARIRRLFA